MCFYLLLIEKIVLNVNAKKHVQNKILIYRETKYILLTFVPSSLATHWIKANVKIKKRV